MSLSAITRTIPWALPLALECFWESCWPGAAAKNDMETAPESDSNLADATKRVGWRVLAMVHNRAELLMVEIQEERERARLVIFAAVGMSVFGLLAGITITAAVACAAPEHLLLTLSLFAAFYTGAAVFCYWMLARWRRGWEALPDTREQLQKDRECLEKNLT